MQVRPPPRPLAARWLENNNMAAMCTPEVAEGGGPITRGVPAVGGAAC